MAQEVVKETPEHDQDVVEPTAETPVDTASEAEATLEEEQSTQSDDSGSKQDTADVSDGDSASDDLSDAITDFDSAVTTEDSIHLEEADTPESAIAETPPIEPPAAPTPQAAEAHRGSFVPTVLGGVVAAGIGFVASLYLFPDWGRSTQVSDDRVPQLEALIAKHSTAIEALQNQGTATVGSDLSSGLDDVRKTQADLATMTTDIVTRLEQIETNLEGLASLAGGNGTDADALLALQEQITKQRSEIEAMLGQAHDRKTEAQLAAKRAALGQVQVALDTGGAFSSPIAELTAAKVAVPQDLTQVAVAGVKSLPELQDSFPGLAREALRTARNTAGEDNGSQGVGALLRSALGARSLEPQVGNGADAVLSRAEAALREGRLHDVLSELQLLPEPAQDILTEWSQQVAQRLAAVSALQALNEELN